VASLKTVSPQQVDVFTQGWQLVRHNPVDLLKALEQIHLPLKDFHTLLPPDLLLGLSCPAGESMLVTCFFQVWMIAW